MLFSLLKKIHFNGTLEFVDFKNNIHVYGNAEPKVRIMCESFNTSLINKCINVLKKTFQ